MNFMSYSDKAKTDEKIDIELGGFILLEYLLSMKNNPNNLKALDIGGALGKHTKIMRKFGLKVDTIDKYEKKAEFVGDFNNYKFTKKYDLIFCSHVIEHQRNQGLFLDKIYDTLKNDGELIISGPCHPAERFVEGHIASTIFPLFLQILIYAGFDCKTGKFMSLRGIENSFIVKKSKNFDIKERDEAGYKWSVKHQMRSPLNLKTSLTIDNTALYLQNCSIWSLIIDDISSPTKKQVLGLKFNLPVNYKKKNINLSLNTFNSLYIFKNNIDVYEFKNKSFVELSI